MSEAPPELVRLFSDKELAEMGFDSWTRTEIIEDPTDEQIDAAKRSEK